MSTSSGASPINGHAHHSEDEHTGHISNGDQSDSDLSDVQAGDADVPRSESVDVAVSAAQMPSIALEDPSDSSDNDASHDADFDMEGSPASARSSDEAHGASIELRTAAKRKSTQALEDEFMRENPELYGLRRSSRPTQRRKVVDSDEEEEEEASDSDATPARRKAIKRRRVERSLPGGLRPCSSS
ncbi:hypothetical protein B0T14DRAFT_71323 [Immersiella caudata]|uniref:Uncharacterized protein n=1 Tax=Immersiella caudata TaxID=314043 RepID=A0AA39XI32_9PEZI|nr:hypothetical protein B0T14DRAFT_71323 [Immersiella caudata]